MGTPFLPSTLGIMNPDLKRMHALWSNNSTDRTISPSVICKKN